MEETKNAVVQRYVDLLSNGGFKAVFGDRNNKDVVISVINMLLCLAWSLTLRTS